MERTTKQSEPTQNDLIAETTEKLHSIENNAGRVRGKRLSKPASHDLDNLLVGVSQNYWVELPRIPDPATPAAQATATLKNTPEFTLVSPPEMFHLKPGERNDHQLEVQFAPKARGTYETEIGFIANFSDNVFEEQRVPVRAKAHELTDPRTPSEKPESEYPAAQAESPELKPTSDFGAGSFSSAPLSVNPIIRVEPQLLGVGANQSPLSAMGDGSQPVSLDLSAAQTQLQIAMKSLFDAQLDGINLAEGEQGAYKRARPEKPFWIDLIQIAIEMGLAVVSERLGAIVGARFAKVLGPEFAEKHEAIVKSFEKLIDSGFETSLKASKALEVEAPEEQEEQHEQEGEATDKSVEEPKKSANEWSSNAKANFFQGQRSAMEDSHANAESLVADGIRNMAANLGSNAPEVLNTLHDLRSDATTQKKSITRLQANASAAEWVKFVARGQLGTVKAKSEPGAPIVTKMTKVHGDGIWKGNSGDGLLELFVARTGEGFELKRARVTGVAQDIANRLLVLDLKKTRMPIAIRVSAWTVTIDEAGRVRSDGPVKSHNDGIAWSEGRDAQDVQQLVEQVLSRPLSQQNLKEIETDDVGQAK